MSKKDLNGYLPPNRPRLIVDFAEGVKISDSCRISDLEKIFSWMRGFLNCFTGFAGFGKTEFVMFLMLVKSVVDDWKWGIWSPEMIDTIRNDKGELERSAHRLYNMLVHAYTGKNPYKHKGNQMEVLEYNKAMDWIERHFFVLDTDKDKTPERIIAGFTDLHKTFEIDGWLVDPHKNMTLNETKGLTKDRVMEAVFDQFEDLCLSTDTVGNFIAHPKNMDESRMRKKGKLDGEYKIITEHDLLGGSAWSNSMDGINCYHRQEKHIDPNSPKGMFISHKQKSQALTHELGEFKEIYFDKKTNRFYFNGVCPIDGSRREAYQTTMDEAFTTPGRKKRTVGVKPPEVADPLDIKGPKFEDVGF